MKKQTNKKTLTNNCDDFLFNAVISQYVYIKPEAISMTEETSSQIQFDVFKLASDARGERDSIRMGKQLNFHFRLLERS